MLTCTNSRHAISKFAEGLYHADIMILSVSLSILILQTKLFVTNLFETILYAISADNRLALFHFSAKCPYYRYGL